MPRTALYPGTFDPLTNGHVDMLEAAFRLCERLVIAVGVHPAKSPMLPVAVRLELIETVAGPLASQAGAAVEVRTFDKLVVEFAREVGATLLIRGLRDGTDLDYEMQMAGMNATMAPGLQTVFLPARPAARHITATLVRQIAAMGGDAAPFVPPVVAARLAR
jgi:pantetheine-phosphate adenylyltransferase